MEQSEESQENGGELQNITDYEKEKWWCREDSLRERKWGKILKVGERYSPSMPVMREKEKGQKERGNKEKTRLSAGI